MKIFFQKYSTLIILLFCFGIGFFLRVYNLSWDQGLLFHPDERNIANAVTKIVFFKQLNPQFFAYGGFSIYIIRAVGDLMTYITNSTIWIMDWGKIDVIGRFFSSVFSILTLLPLFFIAKKLFGKEVAILSCLFYTFTVTSIQHAHFATTESLLVLLISMICFLSILWLDKPKFWKIILLGIVSGISLATKTSALSFFVVPAASFLLYVLQERKDGKKLVQLFIHICFFAVISGIFFFVFSPFTFLDQTDFLASMHYESGVATGSLPVVYTYQFNGSVPYLFQVQNFVWQFGPLLTLFGVVGLALLIFEPIQKIHKKRIIFWIFPLMYFLYVGSWHTKFLRYMTPMIPFLIIAGSYLLILIQNKFKKFGAILILFSLLITICWAGAFFSIYTRPQTRVVASDWIYAHVSPGSRILTEAWDDGLPVPLSSFSPSEYSQQQLDMYQADGPQKVIYLSDQLSHADYIVINSRRLYGTLMRLTDQYPITSRYYKLLFAGKLGYKNIATFSSYPQLFGLTINDDSSEETFQVYEHPKVLIFQNVQHLSEEQLMNVIQ